MFQLKILPVIILFSYVATASAAPQEVPITKVIDGALLSIERSQKKNEPPYFDGEWPANMKSYLLPALLGVARPFGLPVEEPTAFVSSSMAKALNDIYKYRPQDSRLPLMAQKALKSTEKYRADKSFGYYSPMMYHGVKVRGPKDNDYVPNYIRGLTHVPPDSDTTSVTYTAHMMWDPNFKVPPGAFENFAKYRDIDRRAHYYNFFLGMKNTGAFLTWQINEKDPKMPRSLFAPPEAGERIPFRVNDVDCIVNGNVLTLLAMAKQFDLPGYQDSCETLNQAVLKSQQKMCGIYYPNSYALYYTNSNAFRAGAKCLEKSRPASIRAILQSQNADGSWNNEPGIGRTDMVQSTALAMNALMNFLGNDVNSDFGYQASIHGGARFLKSQAKCEDNGECSFEGEVFFSAVSQARNTVLWRSTPYTTALATLALVRAHSLGLGGK